MSIELDCFVEHTRQPTNVAQSVPRIRSKRINPNRLLEELLCSAQLLTRQQTTPKLDAKVRRQGGLNTSLFESVDRSVKTTHLLECQRQISKRSRVIRLGLHRSLEMGNRPLARLTFQIKRPKKKVRFKISGMRCYYLLVGSQGLLSTPGPVMA
jgi:hypothetical protein